MGIRRALTATLVLCLLPCLLGLPQRPAGAEGDFFDDAVFDEARARIAVAKAIRWLEKKQAANGSFGTLVGHGPYGSDRTVASPPTAGPTALVVYALLRAGRAHTDPMVKRGLAYLRAHHRIPDVSYDVSMLLLAVTATGVPPPAARAGDRWKLPTSFRGWANQLAETLIERRTARGWRYNQEGQVESAATGGPEDLCSTCFAMLALHAAQRCGVRIPAQVWRDGLSYARDQQSDAPGPEQTLRHPADPKKTLTCDALGFSYIRGLESPDAGQPTGGMTAAGLICLELGRYSLSDGMRERAAWNQSALGAQVQADLYSGLAWLARSWHPSRNPQRRDTSEERGGDHMCWRFLLGTALDLLGLAALDTHDWYAEMGQRLLDTQAQNGHWDTKPTWQPSDTLDTALAILFLSRHARGLIPHPHVTGGAREAPRK